MKNIPIRKYLLAGLVVWLPILVTFVILSFIVEILDKTISLLPTSYQPEHLFGYNIPGVGVILSLVLLFFTGIFATNFFGQRLFRWSESILDKIPLVRSIYNGSKQVSQALFATNSDAFRKALLVQYPRKGLWCVAFQTGTTNPLLNQQVGKDLVSLYVPTTPNPTSGFLILAAKSEIIELNMTVDEALKFTISLGMMQPVDSTPVVTLL